MTPPTARAASVEPTIPELGDRLAEALGRLADGAARPFLERLVRRLCTDRAEGHVCLRLDALHERADDAGPWPAAADLRAALLATTACRTDAPDATPAPLVLDAEDRLYLLRDFAAERTIRDWLVERLGRPERVPAALLKQALAQPGDAGTTAGREPDWQLAAVAAAARGSFLLLTGGPGTGKTTTVARLLGVLRQHDPNLRIAVCAPTGKAAARLGEALAQRAADRPELAGARPLQPTTLHRLLGYLPLEDAFRAGPNQRLPYDLVVVDEASMLDPAVLAVLCQALPDDARLVLVGDRDQLAAVAAGQVLGDLCRAAAPERGTGPALARFVATATGMALPEQPAAPPIADHVIALQTNHRFGSQPGIAGFAQALARRRPDDAFAVLEHGHQDLVHAHDADAALQAIATELLAAASSAANGTPADATAALLRARVLCAVRHGPTGTDAWNRRVEALLAKLAVRTDEPWYLGRPILVTANDHQNRIWNGDLGVVVRDGDRRAVAFAQGDGKVRLVPPLRLPAHETAWAMTVHKAQGSEFAHVLLVMPDQPGPLWQASVLYTGITRARSRAILLARDDLLADGLRHWPNRASGLAAALRPRS